MTRVAIVGGGVSGLAAAYYASRAGLSCTLIEAAPKLGGVIQTDSIDGCLVEAGPDSFISQKPWALDLIRELGLESEVIGSNDHLRKTYVVRRGRLLPLPDGMYLMAPTAAWPVLTSRLLSLAGKSRLALELLRRPLPVAPDRSVAEFVRQHYGPEAVDYLAEPLLAGIYGGDVAELSANSVLPRLVELEKRYGSITRGILAARRDASGPSRPLFLSLRGGMGQLIAALEKSIAGAVRVARGDVQRVEPAGSGYRVYCTGTTVEAEQVVLAVPAWGSGALLRELDTSLAGLLSATPYHSSITVALGYDRAGFRRPLNGFGFLVPRVERELLTACTWVGTKFPHRVPADRVLLRGFVGAGPDESPLAQPDAALEAAVRGELRRLMGVSERPRFRRIARWPRAMAQYTVGHQRRLQEIQSRLARLPGIHLAGNGYIGIGIPDCIRTAQLVVERITDPLAAGPLSRPQVVERP